MSHRRTSHGQAHLYVSQIAGDAHAALKAKVEELTKQVAILKDGVDTAWGVIANVSGGDWKKQPSDWQEAAACWRDKFYLSPKKDLTSSS